MTFWTKDCDIYLSIYLEKLITKKEKQIKLTRFFFSILDELNLCSSIYVPCCEEHKFNSSSIKKHFTDKHDCLPDNINQHFKVLRKCKTKHDCLIYEMLYIRELSPSLNVQSDSIKAKLYLYNILYNT